MLQPQFILSTLFIFPYNISFSKTLFSSKCGLVTANLFEGWKLNSFPYICCKFIRDSPVLLGPVIHLSWCQSRPGSVWEHCAAYLASLASLPAQYTQLHSKKSTVLLSGNRRLERKRETCRVNTSYTAWPNCWRYSWFLDVGGDTWPKEFSVTAQTSSYLVEWRPSF